MAYKSVAKVKDSISGILQGLNLNSVKNLNLALERSARQIAVLLDIPEAQKRANVTLYDGVTDYTGQSDIFGAAITDIRQQGNSRDTLNAVVKQFPDDFDRQKGFVSTEYKVTMEWRNGIPVLRVASGIPLPRIELDPMTATTGWIAAGSAASLVADSTVYWQTPASLRFTLTGASTGTLTKTIPAQDLTDYRGVGVVFLAFRTPSASNLTSISVRLGSSASAYYEVSNTTGFLGAWTAGDWILVALDLATATTTGSPTITAITYAQVRITHGATLTNFYVGDLWIALPSPHTLVYQTDAIFQDTNGNINQTITNDNDTINLNDAALAIYEIQASIEIAQQQGGSLAGGIAILEQKLNGVRGYRGVLVQMGLLDLYRVDNPSQELRVVGSYYE